jgi:hypothetical protein
MIISDPTNLITGGDTGTAFAAPISINTATKVITIAPGSGILPSTADGVTGQAFFSALKLLWKNSSTYIKLPFPMEGITPESFEFISGWTLADLTTRKALRTCGWAEKNTSGAVTARWAGVVSLGALGATDQPYYQQIDATGAAVNFTFPGPVNEAVQVLSDPNGDGVYTDGFDRRGYFTLFAREQQKIYASAVLNDIGVTSMSTIAYRFPLANYDDLKVLTSDSGVVAAPTIYGSVTATYYTTDQVRNIGGSNYNFRVIIDGNGKTAEQIYTKIQYLLRQNVDIDTGAGTSIGKVANSLLRFVGDTLITTNGVYIDNFNANDTNRLKFTDTTGAERQFPFVAAGSILFNTNLSTDPAAVYRMYFATNPLGNYGTTNAVLVKDSLGNDIAGLITGNTSVSFSFNYDSNVQGGRTPGVDVDVVLVAIGLTTGTFVSTTGTITRSIGQNFSLVSAIDRVYLNA